MSGTTTFKVSSVAPEKVRGFGEEFSDGGHVATQLISYKKWRCTDIIQGTKFQKLNLRASSNGFVHTVADAYNRHHNLVIRPDDVWIAIMVQFSLYVNDNAEEFRGKFVNFEGKKQLTVSAGGRLYTAPYDFLVKQMTDAIQKNLVDEEIKNWVLPDFTTTEKDDIVTCGVILMASMKKYFDYKFCLLCGIPNITLEGTIEDWKNIYRRLNKLRSYKLDKWVDMLDPILEQFINAKSGKVNVEFWDKVCHYSGGGSGPRYLSGWITVFCVFNEEGKWQGNVPAGKEWPIIDTNDIPPGSVEVDVLIDDNGTEHKSVMFAGHMASYIHEDGCTLQPKSGWVIALKPDGVSEPCRDYGCEGDNLCSECLLKKEDAGEMVNAFNATDVKNAVQDI